MPFTEEQEQKIRQIVQPLLTKGCYVCGSVDWKLFEDFIAYNIFDGEYKILIDGKVIPAIAVICRGCGNTHTFSATDTNLL
jgi:hypothetical protein